MNYMSNEAGSVFIQMMAFFLCSSRINGLKGFSVQSVMVGKGTGREEASKGVLSNTLKPFSNAQTVRG